MGQLEGALRLLVSSSSPAHSAHTPRSVGTVVLVPRPQPRCFAVDVPPSLRATGPMTSALDTDERTMSQGG